MSQGTNRVTVANRRTVLPRDYQRTEILGPGERAWTVQPAYATRASHPSVSNSECWKCLQCAEEQRPIDRLIDSSNIPGFNPNYRDPIRLGPNLNVGYPLTQQLLAVASTASSSTEEPRYPPDLYFTERSLVQHITNEEDPFEAECLTIYVRCRDNRHVGPASRGDRSLWRFDYCFTIREINGELVETRVPLPACVHPRLHKPDRRIILGLPAAGASLQLERFPLIARHGEPGTWDLDDSWGTGLTDSE